MILDAAFIFIFGLIVGSFLNVIIYRTPKHESIVTPASHCTVCGSTIKWYDNIPVISFLLLRGRCRKCGETISAIYPAVEIVTALIFLIFYLKFSLTLPLLKYILFAAFLIALSAIDFFHYILPDFLAYPLMIIGLFFTFFLPPYTAWALVSAAAASLFLFMLGLIVGKSVGKEALGFGDVKLIFAISIFLGIKGAIFTLFFGSILGIIAAILIFRKKRIPFGPFLSLAAICYPFFGQSLFNFLLRPL